MQGAPRGAPWMWHSPHTHLCSSSAPVAPAAPTRAAPTPPQPPSLSPADAAPPPPQPPSLSPWRGDDPAAADRPQQAERLGTEPTPLPVPAHHRRSWRLPSACRRSLSVPERQHVP
eukprot:scaffold15005_cov112-Isochrysis_galbana.AAC.3